MHELREIVNPTLYVDRTSIPREHPPHDSPSPHPHTTVYDYYAKWEADGTPEQVHHLLGRAEEQHADVRFERVGMW